MPNGGLHFCAKCSHFVEPGAFCSLRRVSIQIPYRTTCRNFNQPGGEVNGPLYAMVGEAKGGILSFGEIPYCNGCRADTVQLPTGETIVRFTDAAGQTHEFPSIADYLRFYAGQHPT